MSDDNSLTDRAKRLFEFLTAAQQLKATPTRTIESYKREGGVLWLADLPQHDAVRSAHRGLEPEPTSSLFSIERVPYHEPPKPAQSLSPWLNGGIDDPGSLPKLRDLPPADPTSEQVDESAAQNAEQRRLSARPHEIEDEYQRWAASWNAWSACELRDKPVREVYRSLYSTYVAATGRLEDLELVIGVGCLSWQPDSHDPVHRHMLTAPAQIEFDDDSGKLTVGRVEALDSLKLELDMLDPGLIVDPQKIDAIKDDASVFAEHPLHSNVGGLVSRLVYSLDADGTYREDASPPVITSRAVAAYAPALILRKRSQQGLVEIFQTITEQLSSSDNVPAGLLPLVDPNRQPAASRDTTPGGIEHVDDEAVLPLPVNERQLRVVRSVNDRAQTVVQGPPGTGKTHTAAALLSHLLAQGKRVLVTAHTDRALNEVRSKLPDEIKPLSVSVIGSSQSDMAELRVAVSKIASAASEHDSAEAERIETDCLAKIDDLRRHRATTYRKILEARESEVVEHRHGSSQGTLAAIAMEYQESAEEHEWILKLVDVEADGSPPVSSKEIVEWRSLLNNADLVDKAREAKTRLIGVDQIPTPEEFAKAIDAEADTIADLESQAQLLEHEAFEKIRHLELSQRARLQKRMRRFAQEIEELGRRREVWMDEALYDIRVDRRGVWQARANEISRLIAEARRRVEFLGPLTTVTIDTTDVPRNVALARQLLGHLENGTSIKTASDGSAKIGIFAPKPVKQAGSLFESVRVNGLPPVTKQQLHEFLAYVEVTEQLAALDRAWPATVNIPPEDTLAERLQWHITEHQQLKRVLLLGDELDAEGKQLTAAGLGRPDWTNLESIRTYAKLVDAAGLKDASTQASVPLQDLDEKIARVARLENVGACIKRLQVAVRQRDESRYANAHAELVHLHDVRALNIREDALRKKLESIPRLRDEIIATSDDPAWGQRLPRFEDSWSWASTGAWILSMDTTDVNILRAQMNACEVQIRQQVETLAATRAWTHVVSPDRLTGQAHADLNQYAALVRRLGKGTGKYAAQIRAEIRDSMARCRPAVPVWIMPIFRIAEQIKVSENMFDVVIVDEASQAGLEATFLQYLAPKIAVIGDDKQVSPAAVGVDQQKLRDLANHYLPNDRYKASWQDPKRSFFDEARMRFGHVITLTEHRRCVPEIIGFSNRIAYEPEGVRLIPVRQYGADRLDPIKAVHVADGYERGSTNKVNWPEVVAVVDQIEKCLADPRYDGLTFGVISLLGSTQAKEIQARLLERVPPEEWTARELRCGDAPDFQGSERDVMFLSMVAAPEPGRRLSALTQERDMQRYNVAASRAKDQLWLFHSVTLDDVSNPEDMRFALLDYCYGVINRTTDGDSRVVGNAVPEDERVEPFDSLFEQRVFNRLFDRGYAVIPQYPAEGYKIDLVVLGLQTRLAVECDGDAWHGPAAFEADLARQRDLERCGWQFFRIRESAFYVDQAAALEDLWRALENLDIHPSGWSPDVKKQFR